MEISVITPVGEEGTAETVIVGVEVEINFMLRVAVGLGVLVAVWVGGVVGGGGRVWEIIVGEDGCAEQLSRRVIRSDKNRQI